jgi:hypothetical protein
MTKKLLFILFSFLATTAFGQSAVIQWQKSLGGTGQDVAESIRQTTDGGYIIAGYTNSNDGDITSSHGRSEYWVVKLSDIGTIQWQKTFGGKGEDVAKSIQQTTDGGYIVAGYTGSADGDVTGIHGGYSDIWVVKLSGTGTIEWQQTFGGSTYEYFGEIQQTTDGGYVFAGMTTSSDGDVTSKKGTSDFWVVKLSDTGTLQWQKTLGGTALEEAHSIQQTADGGYIVAGNTSSNDGDVTGLHSAYDDVWVVKLSPIGDIQWQKALGGSSKDIAYAVRQASDSGYIIAGSTYSNNGDVTGNHGGADAWIIKLSRTGGVQWKKVLGGPQDDVALSIALTPDGGYLMAGSSQQTGGQVTSNQGDSDYWIVKMNGTGTTQWQHSLGGSLQDISRSVQPTSDGGCIVAGYVVSNNGDVLMNHGSMDYWIVKMLVNPVAVTNVSFEEELSIAPNPATTAVRIQSERAVTGVWVTDLAGRVVYKKDGEVPATTITVPTAALPNGLYLLQIQSNGSTQKRKLQVQH